MIKIDRRAATVMALLGPVTATTARAQGRPAADRQMTPSSAPTSPIDHIAMLVYPGMTALDVIGPQSMFASIIGGQVHLVARTLEPVTSDTGVTLMPTATFETCPDRLAVLFAPGGTEGTFAAMQDPRTRAFMADRGAQAGYVTSVSTGSLILAAAGLLTGYRATSHWAARDSLAAFGAIPTDARVVRDRNRITGAGVTAGLDFGLTMVAELRGEAHAKDVQLLSEYDPQPPFHSGSPQTASAADVSRMRAMLEPQVARVHAIARSLRATA
jgi:putative intracellular protease/amidase